MNQLIYINGMGPNYKGQNIYEFIFSESLEVWGENWDSKPANGYPTPPDYEYVTKVGTLVNDEITLELIQESEDNLYNASLTNDNLSEIKELESKVESSLNLLKIYKELS